MAFPEESCSEELPVSSFDFDKIKGMSDHDVDGRLVFYFLEMVNKETVLFLEIGKIKGYLEKPKIFVFQPFKHRMTCPSLLALPSVFSDLHSKKNCIVSG